MTQVEESAMGVDTGELSRDFGLDITISDGGLVTSALNQRQYKAECSRLYQQFKLTMADYIFEEKQLQKRLQALLLQKKQPRIGISPTPSEVGTLAEELEQIRDEDAFTPSQMEEFRQLATSKASHRSISRAGIVTQTDLLKTPTSISIRVPSRHGDEQAETPHIFPALKERPLTQTPTSRTPRDLGTSLGTTTPAVPDKRHSLLYGGSDQECDGVMDPTADFSTNRRMRMNPRAFSKLSSAGRIKVTVMDKDGPFVMKPVSGKPGVVSLHGHRNKDEPKQHVIRDSKDKLALIKTVTSFKTPTLSSELKTNNLVAIQKTLLGQEAKRMTVGDVMAKSRDRRARLFRVQMSTGRSDDWNKPGNLSGRPSTRIGSAACGGNMFWRRSSRLETSRQSNDLKAQEETETPKASHETSTAAPRAKTAPASQSRHRSRSVSNTTPRTGRKDVPEKLEEHCPDYPSGSKTERTARPRVSVVQLKLQDSPQSPQRPKSTDRASPDLDDQVDTARGSRSARGVFPISTNNLQSDVKDPIQDLQYFEREQRTAEALGLADQECSVQVKQISSLRDSALVVRRWKEQDKEREERLNKWRMRMSFGASRRGNLGKVLSKV